MNAHPPLTHVLAPALLALAGAAAAPAAQAADVGVSIGFSQPGAYGRVDIGRFPQPVLVAPQPVIIGRPAYREPVYLWVPPAHRRDWRHNCYRYNACGAQVYFVEDNWYRHNVAVRQDRRERHGPPPDRRHDRDDHRDRHDHDDRRDDDRRHDHR
ncbi:hypothetical protein [Roseateles sp.]|uniref:hypothetical protein n=1 Tax=Roseateles sp. TaxID=1971397 RepID=UPI003BA8F3A4